MSKSKGAGVVLPLSITDRVTMTNIRESIAGNKRLYAQAAHRRMLRMIDRLLAADAIALSATEHSNATKFSPLFAWRLKLLKRRVKPDELAALLGCEGTPAKIVPAHLYQLLVDFRHLRQDARKKAVQREFDAHLEDARTGLEYGWMFKHV